MTILLLLLAAPFAVPAAEGVGSGASSTELSFTTPPRRQVHDGPYCGVYSLYGALRAIGVECDFEGLLDSRYISSEAGSSLSDLRRAALDCGAQLEAFSGCSLSTLESLSCPAILHVRDPQSRAFNHWILFLGTDGEGFRVVDSPNALELVSGADLLTRWDGVALLVSRDGVNNWAIRAPFLIEIPLASCWIFCGSAIQLRKPGLFKQLVMLGAAVLAASFCWQAGRGEGYFRDRAAVAEIAAVHYAPDLIEVDRGELALSLRAGGTLIVDARHPSGYAAGHIDSAINIPFATRTDVLDKILRETPTDRPVIVYCQSRRCGYDEEVGRRLRAMGFSDVRLYQGGWEDWTNAGTSSD